jgi:hypothetical protein
MSGEPGHIASGDQVRIVRELGAEQAAVTILGRLRRYLLYRRTWSYVGFPRLRRPAASHSGDLCRVGRTATLSLSCQSWGVSAIAAPGVSSPRPG